MSVSLIYDLSRLVTRVTTAAPNGIDRVDLMLARHFATSSCFDVDMIGLGFRGPRLLPMKLAKAAIERVERGWKENSDPQPRSGAFETLVAWLQPQGPDQLRSNQIIEKRNRRVSDVAQTLIKHLPSLGKQAKHHHHHGAIYLNTTHFPLEWHRHVRWLKQRPDIQPVFFIHDLLPLQKTEWFWPKETQAHRRRIDLLAARGAGAIVTSASLKDQLFAELKRLGRKDLPIHQMPLPVEPLFCTPSISDKRLRATRFFIACGTIEPRKNHLLLVRVWRQLIEKYGRDTPRLVLVGKRGWQNDDIIAALQDPALKDYVIEVSGLPTPDYKILLDHCMALLAPSLAEGFGLPLAEAIHANTPVIASDIVSFREQGGANVTLLDPRSPQQWQAAIENASTNSRDAFSPRPTCEPTITQLSYCRALEGFLRHLAEKHHERH